MAHLQPVIEALASYHPETVLDNGFFETILKDHGGTTAEWIASKVGIHERRAMVDYRGDLPVFEIARRAVQKLIDQGTDLSSIDLIISCSSTDDLHFPTTANLISEHFGLHVPAFQIKNGCASVLFGLETARGFLHLGYKRILIVNGEPFTTQVNYQDRASCILFGDASTAMVVTNTELAKRNRNLGLKLLDLKLGGRGSRVISSTLPGSSPALSIYNAWNHSDDGSKLSNGVFSQKGKDVFEWVTNTIPDTVQSFLHNMGRDIESVKYFVGHQSNLSMLEAVREALKIPPEKHLFNISKYGNVSSAGWVSVLVDALQENRIKSEDEILVSVFGAGLSWGNALFRVTEK